MNDGITLANAIYISAVESGAALRDILGMTAADVVEVGAATNVLRLYGQNIGYGGSSFASGIGVIFIGNRATAPSGTPSGGGILYASSGALRWKGSSGTDTPIAPA